MTTYNICKASGESLGTFEADSAADARDAWARSWGYESHDRMPSYSGETGLIITAVGLPEAPAACPFNLPLAVGSAAGRVPDQIFDARDQAVLILYAVDSKGSVDEARTMSWNQSGLARADYVVKAVNEHEGLVKLVDALTLDNRKLVERVSQLERELQGVRRTLIAHNHIDVDQFTAKPVDRRKD